MIDFLHAVSDSTPSDFLADGYYDESLIRGAQTYRAGLKVVREAAGEDTYLLSSSGPTYQNVGFMDACRVGNDYGEGRALNPESYFYPATFVINSASFWTSHRAASDAMAAGYFTHRKLYLADSGNLLTVDKPIPQRRPDDARRRPRPHRRRAAGDHQAVPAAAARVRATHRPVRLPRARLREDLSFARRVRVGPVGRRGRPQLRPGGAPAAPRPREARARPVGRMPGVGLLERAVRGRQGGRL
jgi:hypothetical protein